MAWRTSHFVAAGALVAGGLAGAARDACPGRRPLRAPAIVVDAAYAALTTALGRRETLAEVLARGGIRGRDYTAFLAAAKSLPVRRLRPGLKFDLRRLKTDSIARRVTVRLSPERRLTLVRREGETGWVETVETIPWVITRLRVTGAIESSLYDALDKAMADSFLPAPERRQLAWAIADVRSEEHTSELQSRLHLVCRLLLERKKKTLRTTTTAVPAPELHHDHDSAPPVLSAGYT